MIIYYIYRRHPDDAIMINGYDFDNRAHFNNWIKSVDYYNIMREIPVSCAKRLLPKHYRLNDRIDISSFIKIKL
jgi:hypothetical protein